MLFTWLNKIRISKNQNERLGESETLAVATTSDFYSTSVKQDDTTSSFQLWRFDQSLLSDTVTGQGLNINFLSNLLLGLKGVVRE